MIYFLNRTELISTQSVNVMAKVRAALSSNNIEHRVKTSNKMWHASSPMGSSPYASMGKNNSQIVYTIYVKHDDLEYAKNLIR